MAKLDHSAVDLPKLPVKYTDFHDGDDWTDAAREFGWTVPLLWGAHGNDLGRWPLTMIGLYSNEEAWVWALVIYEEGDMEVSAFDTKEERDRAVTDRAVFWWRNGDSDAPPDLPDTGYLEHHHGRFPGV
ncbi:hypothetical protein ACFYOT_21975 [Saccharothrix saharensis]|uniref:hypothetical protein n=1 Tax=Saccharothrix saharensis TaxID=571190 RepID=UPI0036C7842E